MIRNQPRTTQVGWALVAALTVCALIPSTHWLRLLAQGTLFAVGLLYVWYVTRPSRVEQRVAIHIEGVESEDRARFGRELRTAFDEDVTPVASTPGATDMTLTLRTRDSLDTITKKLRGLGLPMGLLTVNTRLGYTTTTARAHLEVEVSGVASPHAKVFLPGVSEPVPTDGRGHFRARVPFTVVRSHASKGYLPGVWRKNDIEEEMRVPIPA